MVLATIFVGAPEGGGNSTAWISASNNSDALVEGGSKGGFDIAVSATVLLLVLKLIVLLRALPTFGFLIFMLISTLPLMVPFLTLLCILIGGL